MGAIARGVAPPQRAVHDEGAPPEIGRHLDMVFAKLVTSCAPHGPGALQTHVATECAKTATIRDLKTLLVAKARVVGVHPADAADQLMACVIDASDGSMSSIAELLEKWPISEFVSHEGAVFFAPRAAVSVARKAAAPRELKLTLRDAALQRDLFETRFFLSAKANVSVETMAEYMADRLHASGHEFDVKKLIAYAGDGRTPMPLDLRLNDSELESVTFYTTYQNDFHLDELDTKRRFEHPVETNEEMARRLDYLENTEITD